MMAAYPLQELYRDIALLPANKLVELRQFIDFLRFTLEPQAPAANPPSIMNFAGSWQTMPDQAFDDLMDDISERRHAAFSHRRANESGID